LPIEQEMVDPKAGIARPTVSPIVPERVHRRVRMQFADGVNPTLIEQSSEQGTGLGLHEGILVVRLSGVDVVCGRHDVKISRQHDRRIECVKHGRVRH
jgi:hypothetical protein